MQATEEYERLIRPIEGQMMRVVWGITQDPEDAEEAFQEALATIWRKWDRIGRHPNPTALILRMCHNAAYDILRKKIRRRREVQPELISPEPAPNPSEIAASRERESVILNAIGHLSRQQAQAVIMRLVEGESYDAIGRILGCKDSTARKHVERGRERLTRMLAPWFARSNGETCNEIG